MSENLTTYQGRQAERDRHRARLVAAAEVEALRVGRSLKCAPRLGESVSLRHADAEGGCKNDGSTCICWCHDPAPAGGDVA